jgi:nitrile hydratase subunit beta
MDGIHDLGGMHGFGPVVVDPDEPVFHAAWEGRVFALAGLAIAGGIANLDAFRHAIERLSPVEYLTAGYYGRWLAALERLVAEHGALPRPPRATTARRDAPRAARFAAGDAVVARNVHPAGHTRLPRYVRGRRGVVVHVHPAWVFPDTNAHERGEHPQHVYAVRFAATELWGDDADPAASVYVDLFESYLEPAA